MRYNYRDEVIPLITIYDVFSKVVNQSILKEAVSLSDRFQDGVTGDVEKSKNFRTNVTAYYDNIYNSESKPRTMSTLLQSVEGIFSDTNFREILASSPYPLNMFPFTNTHESQVSRYGNDSQHYTWHIDRFDNLSRVLTFVYYFFEEPKTFTGGDIQFTNSPIYDGVTVQGDPKLVTIIPENNMAAVFSSTIPHRVLPTSSPVEFSKGRFSLNCWIGKQ